MEFQLGNKVKGERLKRGESAEVRSKCWQNNGNYNCQRNSINNNNNSSENLNNRVNKFIQTNITFCVVGGISKSP